MKILLFLFALLINTRGAVIYSGLKNIPIPTTFTGIYVDLDTGSSNGTSFVGWDFNPFFGGTAMANSPSFQPVRVTASNLAAYLNVSFDAVIDGASLYATGFGGSGQDPNFHFGTNVNQFQDGVEGYLGFRFIKNNNAGPYYGWMRLLLTNNTSGALIKDWAYEDTGSGLRAGFISGVPEPSTMWFVGLCAVGWSKRRRR